MEVPTIHAVVPPASHFINLLHDRDVCSIAQHRSPLEILTAASLQSHGQCLRYGQCWLPPLPGKGEDKSEILLQVQTAK